MNGKFSKTCNRGNTQNPGATRIAEYAGHRSGFGLAYPRRRALNSETLDSRIFAHGIYLHHVYPRALDARPRVSSEWRRYFGHPGIVGDVGAGGLYIVTRMQNWGQGAIAHATADYGTKFLIVAGLLNFISAADAYHIAIGKKP